MTNDDLITRIEACAARNGIAPATITSRAVGNSRLYARLKAGKSCTLGVAQRVLDFTARLDASPAPAALADGAA